MTSGRRRAMTAAFMLAGARLNGTRDLRVLGQEYLDSGQSRPARNSRRRLAALGCRLWASTKAPRSAMWPAVCDQWAAGIADSREVGDHDPGAARPVD